jgi:flagellar biosynthesis protein FlhG
MKDQAAELRRMSRSPEQRARPEPSDPTVVVIGSGKGGVGKSVLSVVLASALARAGSRVLLVDGSQNQGNLHILLDVRPACGFDPLLAGEVGPQALLTSVSERLTLLPIASGAEALYALTPTDRARLHLRLTSVYGDFDAVIVDAGPGIENAIRSTMRAGRLVVVSVPEPAALSDAYALIKIVTLQAPGLRIDALINQVRDQEEGRLAFDRLALASRRFLCREIGCLGFVAEHPALRHAVRAPGRLLKVAPEDIVSIAPLLVSEQPREEAVAAGAEAGSPRGDAT